MLMTAGRTAAESGEISAERLRWPGSSADQLRFMRGVYDRHVELSKAAGSTFTADLPERDLAVIEGNHQARKDAAQAATAMLAAARRDLVAAGLAGKVRIGIVSAYRPASRQFEIWQGLGRSGGFPYYYRQMVRNGRLRAGDYGPAAVAAMAKEISGWIASPGYSNHQDGLAIDFGTGAVGSSGFGVIGRRAWFHQWLTANAARFGFHPYRKEAWHWTYRGGFTLGVGGPTVDAVTRTTGGRLAVPDLILRWNVPTAPSVIDVAVHLHGYWFAGLKLDRDIEHVSGLDLAPIQGATGPGRSRPTLTILPRGHDTGVKQKIRRPDGSTADGQYNVYAFPELIKRGGLEQLIQFSLNRFAAAVGGTPPRLGRLILTAHSGGGAALLALLGSRDPHQVHVYDGLYKDAEALAAWARRHIRRDAEAIRGRDPAACRDYLATRGGALRVVYQGRVRGGTRGFSDKLRKAIAAGLNPDLAPWYRVEASGYNHFQIPRQYGWRLLADAAADLPNISEQPSDQKRSGHEEAIASEAAEELSAALEFEAFQRNGPGRLADHRRVVEPEFEVPADGGDPRILDALRRGMWDGAVRIAMGLGVTDANQLTNMIFHARHPSLAGRTIRPEQRDLAVEWLRLRDSLVLPALGAGSAAQFSRRIPELRRYVALVPLLDRFRGDVPLDFLLGWVDVESGGRIDVVTGLDERGFFQVHPAESRDHQLQHQRLTSNPQYSVQAGLQLVQSYVALARKRYPWIPFGSGLFWRVVKLQHAMGSGLTRAMFAEMRKRGIPTDNWQAIKAFEVTDAAKRLHPLLRVRPGRFGHNVDEVFARGARIARSLGR
jgi:hypothetical protein